MHCFYNAKALLFLMKTIFNSSRPLNSLYSQANNTPKYFHDASYVILFTPLKRNAGTWKFLFGGNNHDNTWDYILETYKNETPVSKCSLYRITEEILKEAAILLLRQRTYCWLTMCRKFFFTRDNLSYSDEVNWYYLRPGGVFIYSNMKISSQAINFHALPLQLLVSLIASISLPILTKMSS
jgi:hypothetical protein